MNAKTVGLLSLLLVLGVGTSWGQFNATFCSMETVLTDSCGGGDPLPDGTMVYIYWDQDNDGPDDTDPMPRVGDCFACCNFNSFRMNGEEFLGMPGTFCTDAFVISTSTPQPSRYYLRVPVCERGIRWTTRVLTILNGLNDYLIEEWVCEPCPLFEIASCGASTNFNDRIALTWSEISGEDGYEILRKDADHIAHYEVIAQTPQDVHTFNDFTAAPGQDYLYKIRSFSSIYGQGSESPVARGRRIEVDPIVFGEVIVTTNISGVMSAEAADMDHDGDMDVVAAGMFANKVAWYENNGSWGFTEHELITGWRGARAVDVGDIDSDGDLDIVAVARFENSLIWWERDAVGFAMHPISGSVQGAGDVELANLNNAGPLEILTAASASGEISRWSYVNDNSFTRGAFATNLPGVRSLSSRWFTAPGFLHVCGVAHESGELAIWYRRGSDTFMKVTLAYVPGILACTSGILASPSDSSTDVAFCTDNGLFGLWDETAGSLHIISSIIISPRDVTATLIDGDRRDDLLLASGSEISWWRNTENRFYRNVICDNLPQASVVRGLDAEGDGDTDVLCAGDNEIRFYLSTLNDTLDNAALAKLPEPDDNRISSLPSEFELLANYPNPFNASTNIRFALPEASHVNLSVFDITGRTVATISRGEFGAGYHTMTFDASALSSGVYFYRLEAGSFVETKKMVLMK